MKSCNWNKEEHNKISKRQPKQNQNIKLQRMSWPIPNIPERAGWSPVASLGKRKMSPRVDNMLGNINNNNKIEKQKQIGTSRLEIGGSSGSVGLLQRGRSNYYVFGNVYFYFKTFNRHSDICSWSWSNCKTWIWYKMWLKTRWFSSEYFLRRRLDWKKSVLQELNKEESPFQFAWLAASKRGPGKAILH